jgi:hypothetical protein
MRRLQQAILSAGLGLASIFAQAAAQEVPYVSSPYLDLRYRNSTLNSDKFDNSGHANTLRLQLGYLWAITPHWGAYVEGARVWSLFGHQYDDTTGRYTPYPAEADPQSTELSNAWLGYRDDRVDVRVGRQYIRLNNQRFLAQNAWRQNPQSFDAVTSAFRIASGTVLTYDWLRQVNRTVGADFPDVTQRRWRLNGHVVQLEQTLPLGKLAGYAILIRNNTLAANSVRTTGARWTGSVPLQQHATTLSWTVDVANQQDYANNPQHFSLPYHLAELNYGLPAVSVRVGEEGLGGNGHNAVNIAYGSGHPFDGWVGEFKVPVHGLRDRYGGLFGALPWKGTSWQVTYHNFDRYDGRGTRYGDEIDMGVLAKLDRQFSLELQYGNYRARSYAVDEHKVWLLAEYKFGKQPL